MRSVFSFFIGGSQWNLLWVRNGIPGGVKSRKGSKLGTYQTLVSLQWWSTFCTGYLKYSDGSQ
jgi:hypothetical protein